MDATHAHELSLITGFLGIPGYIITTFFPTIQQFAARRPKLVKILCAFLTFTTFGYALLAKIKHTLMSLLVSYFMFSTTIEAEDPLYIYLRRWLKDRKKTLPEQELLARSRDDIKRNKQKGSLDSQDIEESVAFEFNGLQIFWYGCKPYFVSPLLESRNNTVRALRIHCFGFSSTTIKNIITEAWRVYHKREKEHKTAVYRYISTYGWRCVARRSKRSLDTVVLDSALKADLLEDIASYLSDEAKEWYNVRGIPHRRGYLFHGRPGTGKTSLGVAIAGHFELDMYIISLLDRNITDQSLHTIFTCLPRKALVLLEDIDSAGLTRETSLNSIAGYKGSTARPHYGNKSTRSGVTLSGLLNAIDGADSPEGHLLIMTTNAPDALDEALIRPGRIDYRIAFQAVSPYLAGQIFLRMFSGDVEDDLDLKRMTARFSEVIPDDTFTPAELQGFLLKFRHKPVEALENTQEWKTAVLQEREKMEALRLKQTERKRRHEERKKEKHKKAVKTSEKTNAADSSSDYDSSDISSGNVSRQTDDVASRMSIAEFLGMRETLNVSPMSGIRASRT